MDERQLRGFLAIHEQGSVSKAASQLSQSQPALSQSLLRLEDELGSKLFERTSRGVVPTPAGALFREPASRILAELTRAREGLADLRRAQVRQTRIGLPPPLTPLFDVPLLSRIEQSVPLTSIAFREGTSQDIKAWIDEDVVDFGLLYNVEDLHDAVVRPVFGDELMLISKRGPDEAVDDYGIGVGTVDLSADDLDLMLGERHNGQRRFIEGACQQEGIEIRVAYTVNSFQVMRALLLMGHGHAILPHIVLSNDIMAGHLIARRVARPRLERTIFVVRNGSIARKPASEEVEAVVVEAMDWLIQTRRWFARPINFKG